MTDLHTLADAISDSSPNIKAFAEAVADKLEPVTPPPVPVGAPPLWNGVIPNGQWEFAGTSKAAPSLSERVTTAATIDGISPPPGCSTLTRITTKPGDLYQPVPGKPPATGWRTLGRQPDPLDPSKIKLYGPGHDSSFAFAVYFPATFPGDANVWDGPLGVHQTKASYVPVTGVSPAHIIGEASSVHVDVAGGRDGARVVSVNQSVLPGYAHGTWQVFAMRYLHDLTPKGAFELWHATKGPLVPLIQKSGIGTMYEGTLNYFEWGLYRAQTGTSVTTIYLAGLREYGHLADALAYANGLAK